MGQLDDRISDRLRDFIAAQHLFFVATAPREGPINLSPKGIDSLRVLGPRNVRWLNLTGSGNETAAHLREDDRITLMFCALEGAPSIVRLYGRARAIHPRDPDWARALASFPELPGTRQIIDMEVEGVQRSCGMGVPLFSYRGQRPELLRWAEEQGPEGLADYWRKSNSVALSGRPTGIVAGEED